MLDTKRPSFELSTEPALCSKCQGIGSIWIYSKETKCVQCSGSGVEPKSKND
ncbi:MAG: hypothetical protein NE330_21565 [Lentisphaeraceae bacterium]|nr:hypothetical protein [Lentisphaeraceae bacterium]